MNSVQIHLALTHVPVILSLVGLVMLIVALLMKNATVLNTSYIIIAVAGVAALPVYFSGESAEEAVEHAAGVSKSIIENHEEVAKLAMISIASAGIISLVALISRRWVAASKILKIAVLLFAFTSGALMAQTAHLGGQIRHTEIGNGVAMQEDNNEQNASAGAEHDEDD